MALFLMRSFFLREIVTFPAHKCLVSVRRIYLSVGCECETCSLFGPLLTSLLLQAFKQGPAYLRAVLMNGPLF
jgi:hypothetical protein